MGDNNSTFTWTIRGVGWQQFTNKANAASGAVRRLGSQQKAISGLAARFVGLNVAASVGIQKFRKLIEWVDKSITQFRTFENSMAEVSTILSGSSLAAVNGLTIGVQQLSAQYGKSAVDMSKGLYQILSAAVDAKEALNLLNTATKASIAGLTSVETSVDVLTSVLNSYGKSVAQAAEVSDVLFQTVVRGKLKFEDLASAMGYITPIASAAGVAFEEVAASLATVTRQGLHVDMASRGLALAIQGIVSPTEQAKEAAIKYGVAMDGVALRVFGLKGFIEDLATATDEFGLNILPELVRNMRSLRVVMALVSEEGLEGFSDDLDLVYASTGRTDEALQKMISTQQRQAEIIQENMNITRRAIGEVWSPIKLNIEATKLWFATFLSSGFSIGRANEEVRRLSESIQENTERMWNNIDSLAKVGQKSIFNQLFDMESFDDSAITSVVNSVTDIEKVGQYLKDMNLIQPQDKYQGKNVYEWATNNILEPMQNAVDQKLDWTMMEKGFTTVTQDIFKRAGMGLVTGGWGTFIDTDKLSAEGRQAVQNVVDQIADEIPGLEAPTISVDWSTAKKQIEDYGLAIEDSAISTTNAINDNVDSFNSFFSAIDTAREQVFKFKTNILELENAIMGLSGEVRDTFTDLLGQEHTGSMGLEIDTTSFGTAIDRMENFSTMITKYGSEWEEKFYTIFEGKTFTIGEGQETSYIEEYNTQLKDAVNTVHEYEKAQEEVKKVMNEVNKAIMLNNIAIAEIQLAGMMRRRGLTRQEEKTIKKLQIDNMRERLKEKKAEADAKQDIDEGELDSAKQVIEEYFDSQKFTLGLMKDARDDELAHMVTAYEAKKRTLANYEEALEIQNKNLQKAHMIEVGILQWLEENHPDIADSYEQLYGISIPESIQKSINAMDEWHRKQVESGWKEGETGTSGTQKVKKSTIIDSIKPLQRTKDIMSSVFKYGNYSSNGVMSRVLQSITPHATGIPFVPAEGLYHLHRGETVTPANQSGSGSITVNVNVSGNTITDTNTNDVARQIATQVQQALIDKKSGKTKYRMR